MSREVLLPVATSVPSAPVVGGVSLFPDHVQCVRRQDGLPATPRSRGSTRRTGHGREDVCVCVCVQGVWAGRKVCGAAGCIQVTVHLPAPPGTITGTVSQRAALNLTSPVLCRQTTGETGSHARGKQVLCAALGRSVTSFYITMRCRQLYIMHIYIYIYIYYNRSPIFTIEARHQRDGTPLA